MKENGKVHPFDRGQEAKAANENDDVFEFLDDGTKAQLDVADLLRSDTAMFFIGDY